MSRENLRNEALVKVRRNSPEEWWNAYHMIAMSRYVSIDTGSIFTGTEFNSYIGKLIGQPHHPNAWGSAFSCFVRPLLKNGSVDFVGFEKSSVPHHHAHYVKQYKKL